MAVTCLGVGGANGAGGHRLLGLRDAMDPQRRVSSPILGTAYGDSQRKWGLVQVAPRKTSWKTGEMGIHGAERPRL